MNKAVRAFFGVHLMDEKVRLIAKARETLQTAIGSVKEAQTKWSEAVTELHMSELTLRKAQKEMREAYNGLCDALNSHR